ncbi:MAG: glycerol kinase GlpK [Candidatus Sericytochromatia bacterium]|nr:glycerol kinase GlpK [Candidatus Sericytochromatia bacterium]
MATYVLAIDQGTTGSTAIVFDEAGAVVGKGYREITQHFPQPGWVEHDADEIWERTAEAVSEAIARAGISPGALAGLGITNQRETVVLWERATGRPLHRAIVWQCRRTAETCAHLSRTTLAETVTARTGLVVDAYFSGTKLAWLLDAVPDGRARAARGELAAGTIDTWLLWKLTGGALHATDVTNASRTMLFDIHRLAWCDELLAAIGVPGEVLPAVRPSGTHFGVTAEVGCLPAGLPIGAVAGDQHAALFGQGCFAPGQAKNTYGTGCFMLMNTGTTPVPSRNRLLTTLAWQREGQPACYALEGSVFIAGAAVQWLRDGLGIIRTAAESEALATAVPDTGGVYVVPAFVGLGAPHWDGFARGTMVGLTRGTTKAHIARATLEAIAYQTRDILAAMAADSGVSLAELRVDGGAAANAFLMQFQADVLGVPVVRQGQVESTAWGVAAMAGLTLGVWPDTAALATLQGGGRRFEPHLAASERARLVAGWTRAVERSRGWVLPGPEAG